MTSIQQIDVAVFYALAIRRICLGIAACWFAFLCYKSADTNQHLGVTVFLFALAALFGYRCFVIVAKVDTMIQKKKKGQKR